MNPGFVHGPALVLLLLVNRAHSEDRDAAREQALGSRLRALGNPTEKVHDFRPQTHSSSPRSDLETGNPNFPTEERNRLTMDSRPPIAGCSFLTYTANPISWRPQARPSSHAAAHL